MSRLEKTSCGVLVLLTALSCSKQMSEQEKFLPQGRTPFFADQRTMRVPPEGTIPRGAVIDDEPLSDGTKNGEPVQSFPIQVTMETLNNGKAKYEIHCTPCHDGTGEGDGMVVLRGFKRPRPLASKHTRSLANGELFRITTYGFNTMAGYKNMMSDEERWAVVAYVRALQLSRDIPSSMLAPKDLEKLNKGGAK